MHTRNMSKKSKNLPVSYTQHEQKLAQAIGVRLRTRREELHLTQEQLRTRLENQRVAITRSKYSRIESGMALPNAAQICALVKALETTYLWLLEGRYPPIEIKM